MLGLVLADDRSDTGHGVAEEAAEEVAGSGLAGLFGRPFINLEPLLPAVDWDVLHEEICVGLASVPGDYTGGAHRSMGIMPPGREAEALVDYMEVIRGLSPETYATFCSLGHDPDALAQLAPSEICIGEEQDLSLTHRQMLWLKVRFGVYFPWKSYVELIPNRFWSEKAQAKGFSRLANTFFPRTVAFVQTLPFSQIGRCNIMGLEAHDHGTLHRDGAPSEQQAPDQFITFVPAADKQLFLWDAANATELDVKARMYWFNDFDYHGVRAAPFFRYSVRVDGVFRPEFVDRIRRSLEDAS